MSFAHGGQGNKQQQANELFNSPQLIVGTPGRIIDFVEEGILSLESVATLVLDEADRMFELGLEEQLRMILSQVRPDRQVMMFSATWPQKVSLLSKEYFRDSIHVNIGPEDLSANRNIAQKFEFVPTYKKLQTLISIINNNPNKRILVFSTTKYNCSEINHHLKENRINSVEVHGNKTQVNRENNIAAFKSGRVNVLVATDVAARGLDIKDVKIVVNYDFPNQIENYVHRIGRTGRAGHVGESITFFTPMDGIYARDLINIIKKSGQPVPEQLQTIANNWTKSPNRSVGYGRQSYQNFGNSMGRDRGNSMGRDRGDSMGRERETYNTRRDNFRDTQYNDNQNTNNERRGFRPASSSNNNRPNDDFSDTFEKLVSNFDQQKK